MLLILDNAAPKQKEKYKYYYYRYQRFIRITVGMEERKGNITLVQSIERQSTSQKNDAKTSAARIPLKKIPVVNGECYRLMIRTHPPKERAKQIHRINYKKKKQHTHSPSKPSTTLFTRIPHSQRANSSLLTCGGAAPGEQPLDGGDESGRASRLVLAAVRVEVEVPDGMGDAVALACSS